MKKFGMGQAVRRVEDQRLLSGGGRYVGDLLPEGCLHAVVLRSAHAHARFALSDLDAARALPGVRCVLTAADVADLGPVPCLAPLANGDGSQNHLAPIPVLADGTARHVGDALAFVVADGLDAARDAVEAIAVAYHPLPAVATLAAASVAGAPAVWSEQPDNVAYDTTMGDAAAVDAAFAAAAHVVTLEVENNRLITNYMEPRGALAQWAGDDLTLHVSSQGVHGLRDTLAKVVLKVDPARVRVVTPDVGGGFGTKAFMYREYALAAVAAKRTGRPVRWLADRSDHFVADAQGRDNLARAEVACDADGRFLAMRFDIRGNLGAYLSQYGPYIPYLGATMMTGVYRTPHILVRVRGLYTNTTPVDAYRGAGRPEAAYLLERTVDHVARTLGLSPVEIRRRNFIRPDQMPYATPVGGRTYDTGDFDGHLTQALASAGWDGFADRAARSTAAGRLRGIGIATYIECTAWGDGEDVAIRLEADGTVTVRSGTQSNGQGHATAYAQMVSEHLDVPLESVRVIQGDTAEVATGFGTGGSRSIPVGGVSVWRASADLAEKLRLLASDVLEAAAADIEFGGGEVRVVGTDRRMTLADLARRPEATADRVSGAGGFVPPDATYPNGTHVAEVEIDPETGVAVVVGYTICDDFGVVLNPLLLAGQVHGGVVQGIGQALLERTVFDAGGQLLTGSLMDYALPRADDVPSFRFETRNVPSTTNPLGIKGAGEAGSIGSCPAVMNAVVDALHRGFGIPHVDMPATPGRVHAAIRAVG
jgi:carbon-monoxide dehydrogenase large subunit